MDARTWPYLLALAVGLFPTYRLTVWLDRSLGIQPGAGVMIALLLSSTVAIAAVAIPRSIRARRARKASAPVPWRGEETCGTYSSMLAEAAIKEQVRRTMEDAEALPGRPIG